MNRNYANRACFSLHKLISNQSFVPIEYFVGARKTIQLSLVITLVVPRVT